MNAFPSPSDIVTRLRALEMNAADEAAELIQRLTAERDEMQGELRKAETECSMLRVECGVIAAERDEARREICVMLEDATNNHRENHAKRWGWDCFGQEESK
jgi:uncharacterized protein (DUF58 family)